MLLVPVWGAYGTILMCARRSEAISAAISPSAPTTEKKKRKKCMLNGFNINHQVNKAFMKLFMLMSSLSSAEFFIFPKHERHEKIFVFLFWRASKIVFSLRGGVG